jgi:tRNA (uracil-5-)-methyltransferase TRM9
MELSTIRALAALNQRFYAEHAENFADSRPRLAAGVQRVLGGIGAGTRVLEVGCGDGKVGRALARAGVGAYVGLDASRAMLQRAQRYTMQESALATVFRAPSFAYQLADLTTPEWQEAVAGQSFDWVLAFAVFHHLPGYDLRASVLRGLASHLAPGGRIALSNWQLTRSERMLKRIVPWPAAGLSDENVEPGDYLISWERNDRRGLRYVHVLDEHEVHRLAASAGLHILETFSADGETGDLSEYVVAQVGGDN